MTIAQTFESRLVLSDGSVDPETGFASRVNAAAPLIIGLVAPILLLVMIDPMVLRNAPFLVATILFPMLGFSVAVYAYCVLNPGDVVGLTADRNTRVLELVQANFFATRRTAIPFDEIASLRMVQDYDQDGYAVRRAELVLGSGERMALPPVGDPAELEALRSAIGLRS